MKGFFMGTRNRLRKSIRFCFFFYLLAVSFFVGRLSAQPLIRVAVYDDPPHVFIEEEGAVFGFFPELLEVIAEEQRWEIEYVPGSRQQAFDRVYEGTADLMPVPYEKELRDTLEFPSESVVVNWGTVYSRTGFSVQSLVDLDGRTVAVKRGSVLTDGKQGLRVLMNQLELSCQYVEVDDFETVLQLLDERRVDAGVLNHHFGAAHVLHYEVESTPVMFAPQVFYFAVAAGDEAMSDLLKDLDDTLKRLKKDQRSAYYQLMNHYMGGNTHRLRSEDRYYPGKLTFTSEERQWLKKHPEVRFSIDPGFKPFEMLNDDGLYVGMAADYLRQISELTGIRFVFVPSESWIHSVDALRQKSIDLLPCIGFSDARKEFIDYTEPYVSFARVLVTEINSEIHSLEEASGKVVGVQESSSHHAFLKEKTDIDALLYPTYEDALLAVSKGEVDAVVGNLAVTTFTMQELSLTNIKLSAYASSEPQPLAIGVRKDWPELTSILNRALKAGFARIIPMCN